MISKSIYYNSNDLHIPSLDLKLRLELGVAGVKREESLGGDLSAILKSKVSVLILEKCDKAMALHKLKKNISLVMTI